MDNNNEGLSLEGLGGISDKFITILPILSYVVDLLNKMLAVVGSYLGMNLGG